MVYISDLTVAVCDGLKDHTLGIQNAEAYYKILSNQFSMILAELVSARLVINNLAVNDLHPSILGTAYFHSHISHISHISLFSQPHKVIIWHTILCVR